MSRELQAELEYYNKKADEALEACRVAEEDYHDWTTLVEYKQRQIEELAVEIGG